MVPLCFSLCHIVTWNCGGGNGLGIPTRFRSYGPEKATQWLETRLTKIEEQLERKFLPQIKHKFFVENGFAISNIRPACHREVTSNGRCQSGPQSQL